MRSEAARKEEKIATWLAAERWVVAVATRK